MKSLLPTTYPEWTVEGGLDILATHDENDYEVVQRVGEMRSVIEPRDSRETFYVYAEVLSLNAEYCLPRQRVPAGTLHTWLNNTL